MSADVDPLLSDLVRLALASAQAQDRPAYAALFALDEMLARAGRGHADEPLLVQVRLAWWRDALGGGSPGGPDPVLASLRQAFAHQAAALVPLVDGWEALLTADPLDEAALREFADGRASAFVTLAHVRGIAGPPDLVARHARLWALADFAANAAMDAEREMALAIAREQGLRLARLPRRLRPLALLSGMASRAIRQGRPALLGDRLSPFAAARIALSGR